MDIVSTVVDIKSSVVDIEILQLIVNQSFVNYPISYLILCRFIEFDITLLYKGPRHEGLLDDSPTLMNAGIFDIPALLVYE